MRQILRHEKKFLINNIDFIKKKNRFQQLLHEDPHNGPHGYRIRSLYFDTEHDDDLFNKVYGLEVRRKIRLRFYDFNDDFALLEIKQKHGNQQLKRSLRVNREDALRLIQCDYTPLLRYPEPFASECYALMHTHAYRPRTIIEYQKVAFIANSNNIRITFDHKIRATQSSTALFDPHLLMVPVMDMGQVILEVKYNNFLLSYIKDMLIDLDRSEVSISKYALARQLSYFDHI